jgi:hypothetical protein
MLFAYLFIYDLFYNPISIWNYMASNVKMISE